MTLYRRPKFLEILHEIREDMSRAVDYDVDLFAEAIRTGEKPKRKALNGFLDMGSAHYEAVRDAKAAEPDTKS